MVIDSEIILNDTKIYSLELGLNSFLTFSTTKNQNSSFYFILSNISVCNINQNSKSISSFMNISNAQSFSLLNSIFNSNTICM